MTVSPVFVGTNPTLIDVIVDDEGGAIDLTGATVQLTYRPIDAPTPVVMLTATPDADQVNNKGRVIIVLGSPLVDVPADFACWWHIVFANSTILDTGNFIIPVVTHGPGSDAGATPYMSTGLFRRLSRVKQSRLGIAIGSTFPNAEEFLQTELDRAAVYIEFVTGQPATDSSQPVQLTALGQLSPTAIPTMIRQVIQMRTEQTTFQSQHSYLDDASDDVVTSLSVGSYSQSKSDPARRGEQKSLNTWQDLTQLLWMLMTPDRFSYWEAFLSTDPTLAIGPMWSTEQVIQNPFGLGMDYGFGAGDFALGLYGAYAGSGWGRPTDLFPLIVDTVD